MRTIKKIELRARRVRVEETKVPYGRKLCSPVDVRQAAVRILEGEDQEVFLVFMLDVKNKILGYQEVARGSVDGCTVDIRVVFRAAIMMGATSIILCHCHPSGDPAPSPEDLVLTARLVKAGELLGLPVLDHVIVGETTVSLSAIGRLKS
jgi:DNA repair protein RadC